MRPPTLSGVLFTNLMSLLSCCKDCHAWKLFTTATHGRQVDRA